MTDFDALLQILNSLQVEYLFIDTNIVIPGEMKIIFVFDEYLSLNTIDVKND